MGNVNFTVTPSGMGVWGLDISDPTSGNSLSFTPANPGPFPMSLPIGAHTLVVQGGTPAGAGGGLALAVSGPIGVASSTVHNYGTGTIPPHFINVYVTA